MRTIRKIEKNMKRLLFLASLVAATLLAGCSGKGCPGPERNLVVSGGGAADLRLGMTSRYTVFGSGDYEAVSSDPSVATVAVDGRTLSVTGHAVGRATVTLTDLPSDERVEIAVTVVDFYLCLFVSAGTDDDRTVLRRNDGLFLWANDVCEYRLVRNTAHEWWGQFLEYDELQRGTYALSDDGTTLVLGFPMDSLFSDTTPVHILLTIPEHNVHIQLTGTVTAAKTVLSPPASRMNDGDIATLAQIRQSLEAIWKMIQSATQTTN